MALQVIGAGFGRTGTLSLKLALEQLGFGPCHHMEEVFAKPNELPLWEAAGAGEAVEWDRVFAGYRSCVDWPSARYWRELSARYPDAKVILTLRDADRWWESYAGTIRKVLRTYADGSDSHAKAVGAMAYRTIVEQAMGGDDGAENAKRRFLANAEEVRRTISPGRLLEFEVAQGWEPLCAFLGVPVPDQPFPRSNDRQAFWAS